MSIKPMAVLRWIWYALLGLLAAVVSLRFLLPALAPFLLAAVLARGIEPAVLLLCRQGWRREFASGMCTLALLTALGLLCAAALGCTVREAAALSRRLPEFFAAFAAALDALRERLGSAAAALPPELLQWLELAEDALVQNLAALPGKASAWLWGVLSASAARAGSIVLFAITLCLGVYFISAAYPQLQTWLDVHLPEVWQRRRLAASHSMRFTVGRYVRAQGILMVITFFELLLAFLLLRIEGALLLAALTAFLDALPILGAGAVLLPWAAVCFLGGDAATGAGLLIAWSVISVARNCFQAKLLGDQLGLPPLVTLMALYVGWRFMGVPGMVLLPILALPAAQLLGLAEPARSYER